MDSYVNSIFVDKYIPESILVEKLMSKEYLGENDAVLPKFEEHFKEFLVAKFDSEHLRNYL